MRYRHLIGVGFCAGVLSVQTLQDLPSLVWILGYVGVLLAALCWAPTRPLAAAAAGVLWAVWRAQLLLAHELPEAIEGQRAVLQGVVIGLPLPSSDGLRLQLQVQSLRSADGIQWADPGRVRLFWPQSDQAPVPGETWELVVQLKRPRGFMNPGGFDYEAWLFENGIRATGYVLAAPGNRRLSEAQGQFVDRARVWLAERLQRGAAGREFQGIISALVMGEQRGISQAQWQVLNRTGTSHLVAISGMHVGLLAGLGYVVCRTLWLLAGRWTLRIAAPPVGLLGGFLAALAYTALAGFAVPTVRTVIMIGVTSWGLARSRPLAWVDLLILALTIVLCIDPLAGLLPGFWLSFGAVAVIVYAMQGRVLQEGWWWRFGRVHWVVALGLTPLLIYWFGQNPLLGPLANAVAVPWISFVIVPLALLGALLLPVQDAAAESLFNLANSGLRGLWPYLQWLAERDFAAWTRPSPPLWIALAGGLGVALLLSPRGLPGRWLGLIWLLPLVFNQPPELHFGEFRFTLLDVGQGLAAVVETEHRTLVFDTGARFGENFDVGQGVIAPYLRQAGRDRVDLLLVSHDDSDHSGGLVGLHSSIRVEKLLSNRRARLPLPADDYCEAGQTWQWDGIGFEILNPAPLQQGKDNDLSCVLRVSVGDRAVLLTGDVERSAEAGMRALPNARLHADVLVVPHHGSNTSSSPGFLDAVGPEYALVPAGYRNRYRFPHPQVLARLRERGAKILNVMEEGAIQFTLSSRPGAPVSYRRSARHFWNVRAASR